MYRWNMVEYVEEIHIKENHLFQICGINMRTATHEIAAQILKQVGTSLILRVQYNPNGMWNFKIR